MRKLVSVASAIVVIVLLGLIVGGAGAQSPTPAPPTATPLVVTATPMPQVIVVTATPQPGPPSSWWEENWRTILLGIVTGLVGLILGGVFKPTFERIGQWLARVLSSLGAGRNFRRWYLDYLVDEYRCLNIRGLRTRAPVAVELEQVYVSLRAEVPGAELESAAARRTFTIGQVMDRHQRLAIVGGPGCGKTTLLAYLTLTYTRNQAEERLELKEKRLPILVPLRLLKTVLAPADDKARRPEPAEGPMTLPQYLDARYQELGRKPPPDFFDGQLRAGECLVLLDGLDEVADERERRQMAEWVDQLVATYPRNRYMVTSRPAGYDSAPLENDFSRYEVRDFEMAEVEQFVRHWYLAVETATQGDTPKARREAAQRAAELAAAIRASAGIRRLVVNPLLLSIVALVHRYRAHLPDRRVDLYNECVEVLLEHWDVARGLVGRLPPTQKRAVLQSLALAMHKDEVRQLPRARVERLVAAYLPQVSGGPAKATDVSLFLKEVRERSGLLVEQELNTYAFSHQTFQEYLAACEIAGSRDEAERASLVDQATAEWWREVLLLYAGMRERDPSPMVQALLERDRAGQEAGETDRAYLLLAGECLAETVRIQPGVRREVEEELEDLFTAQLEPRTFLQVGRVLARLKGEDGVAYFLQLMDTGEDRIRTVSALALAQMGREADMVLQERIVRELLSRIDEGEERIRTVSALALGRMGREADAVLLERIIRELLNQVDDRQRAIAAGMALGEVGLAPLMGILPEKVRDELLRELAERSLALVRFLEAEGPQADAALQEAVAAVLDLALLPVPAGEFMMGSEEYDSGKPVHKVDVDTFYVARYPVTNAQWARFVAATGHKPPQHWPDGVCPADKATHPVVYVSWYDAKAYAEWAGLQLPSEAQWEKAARGGLQIPNPQSPISNLQLVDNPHPERRYPWGDKFDQNKCNARESGIGDTTPVGRYSPRGDSPYGVTDMAGNVWEWTSSLYEKYPYQADDGREDAEASGRRVLRGGAFFDVARLVRCSYRYWNLPYYLGWNYGFRVVVAPGFPSGL